MTSFTIIIAVGAVLIVVLLAGVLILGIGRSNSPADSMRGLSAASSGAPYGSGQEKNANRVKPEMGKVPDAFAAQAGERKPGSSLGLPKRLMYAQWSISPTVFHLCEFGVGLFFFSLTALIGAHMYVRFISLLLGPIIMRSLLEMFITRRFKAFDDDFAPFLLSLVGLLKTGMNPMGALEAAAQGLNQGSLLRVEVELMNERQRIGVSEERSIGAFAEDIFHPEIELFVQALLLSKRVGGTLSDTLDRLAKQVRKRQYFRNSANASVAMQRGSIWVIILILVLLECYLGYVYPESVIGAWNDPRGFIAWQFGIVGIFAGVLWARSVTNIRV